MQRSDSPSFSEEKILADLTANGRDPQELCFVLRKGIRRWDPRTGMIMGYMIDNAAFADACREYLRSKGLAFNTPEELERHARAHNWPILEALLLQIEFLKQRWRRKITSEDPDRKS